MQQYSDDYLLAHNPPLFFLEPADKRLGSDKAKKGSNNIAGCKRINVILVLLQAVLEHVLC